MTRWVLVLFAVTLGAAPTFATTLALPDDFEDGTLMSWAYAATSQLTNVATGGPGGVGDHWLRLETDGVSSPGGRPVITNGSQWAGNYVETNVETVEADFANFGSEDLHIRFALEGVDGEQFVTTAAILLPADGVWRHLAFELTAADFTQVIGAPTSFADILVDVERIRFLIRELDPGWNGDELATVLGIDNIVNLPEPGTFLLLGAGLAMLARLRSNPRSA